uniref:NADH dehydrogenase subunit 6 n=1 Tax=Parachtes riberai TaxID=2593099 RepID=A0A516IM71_9ARAC|nr:NADH dehydrogenase subunit 6 [Parachtes riberai]
MVLILFGLLFLLSNHAMSSMLCIIGVVLLYFYMVYINSSSVWFGLVMVLVMLSGVLVVFTYMVSLIPNDKFEFFGVIVSMVIMMFMYIVMENVLVCGFDISFLSTSLWEMDFSLYLVFGLGFLLMIMLFVIEVVGSFLGALRVE